MKNFDFKKFLMFVIIVAIIVACIIGIGSFVKKGSTPSKEESEEVEKYVTENVLQLTYGYPSEFKGVDVLFSKDETKIDDIELGAIINSSIRYALTNSIDLSLHGNHLAYLKETYNSVSAFAAKGVNEAAKKLYGIELNGNSYATPYFYLYNYIFDESLEAYVEVKNEVEDTTQTNHLIITSIVETTKKKDEYTTTVAVAYAIKTAEGYTLYSDEACSKEVVKNDEMSIPEDNIDDFTKFNVITKKSNDSYVFEKIEKVKK